MDIRRVVTLLADLANERLNTICSNMDYKYRWGHPFIGAKERVHVRADIRKFLVRVTGVKYVDISNDSTKELEIFIIVDALFYRDGEYWKKEILKDCGWVLNKVLPSGTEFTVKINMAMSAQ